MPSASPVDLRRTDSGKQLQDSWTQLVESLAALEGPRDTLELRLSLIVAMARLGLATAAREQLAAIDMGERGGEVAAVRASLPSLPHDAVSVDQRIETCRGNLQVLRNRGVRLPAAFSAWERRTRCEQWLRALDGHVLRRIAGDDAPGPWLGAGAHVEVAQRIAGEQIPREITGFRPPITVEGLDPPWLALAAHRRTKAPLDGHTPEIRIVQAHADELLDGLAMTDLRGLLADRRVTLFVGPGAAERYRAALSKRFDHDLLGPLLRSSGLRHHLHPCLTEVHAQVERRQVAELATLQALAQSIYAERDRSWWADRYDRALRPDAGNPLRVLVLSDRFGPSIRILDEDLAAALRQIGCSVRVLIEPDSHTRLAPGAALRAMSVFEPDLVVQVNRTRPPGMPARVPFVCRTTETTGHQADPTARATGELDFTAGQVCQDGTCEELARGILALVRNDLAAGGEWRRRAG